MRAAMKPLPTLMKPLALRRPRRPASRPTALVERSDVSAVEALAVVAEAAVAWELARAAREKFGGDALGDFVAAWRAYLERIDWTPARDLGHRSRSSGSWARASRRSAARSVGLARTRRFRRRSTRRWSAARRHVDRRTLLRARRARRRSATLEERDGSVAREPARRRSRSAAAPSRRRVREALREHASTLWLDVDVDTCWERVRAAAARSRRTRPSSAGSTRSGARSTRRSRTSSRSDADDVVLAAAGVHVERGALQRLGELVPGDGPVALVSDPHVAGIHGMDAQLALGPRLAETHELPPGEEAKTLAALDRLWQELRLDRARHDRRARRRLHDRRRRLRRRRRTCAASRGCPSRRASSRRSTRRSAARRRSTCRRARTSSARSTGPCGP